jgi:hypothetical protein
MASNLKVHAVFGPVNSGESLATTPICARFKVPSPGICVVNSLIDPMKYSNAFRLSPDNSQRDDAMCHDILDILKAKSLGAKAITCWPDSAGLNARPMNARGQIGWDVAMTGLPALGSGDVPHLLEKPGYCNKLTKWPGLYATMRSRRWNATAIRPTASSCRRPSRAGTARSIWLRATPDGCRRRQRYDTVLFCDDHPANPGFNPVCQ